MEYLQRLAAEWYEYHGYFVHTDLWVGVQADGSCECELDLVAFHPTRRYLVHLEPSFDLLSWQEREQHFQPKFAAGRKYLHRMFGTESQIHLEQIALLVADEERPRTLAGARVLRLAEFPRDDARGAGRIRDGGGGRARSMAAGADAAIRRSLSIASRRS
jgi:hypothetical protein